MLYSTYASPNKYFPGYIMSGTAVGVFMVGMGIAQSVYPEPYQPVGQLGGLYSAYEGDTSTAAYRITETSTLPKLDYLSIDTAKSRFPIELGLVSKNKKPHISFEDHNFIREA